MVICNVTGQTVIAGYTASFQTAKGSIKRYYSLESPLDMKGTAPTAASDINAVAADIASVGEPGELRWNPKGQIKGQKGVQMLPLESIRITIPGGTADDVKVQILSGADTRVRRFINLDGQGEVLVDITQKLYPPFKGV